MTPVRAELLENFLDASVEVWCATRPAEAPSSWTKLQDAFLARFEKDAMDGIEARLEKIIAHLGPSVDMLRDEKDWYDWLQRLHELATGVPACYHSEQAKAFVAWPSFPNETRRRRTFLSHVARQRRLDRTRSSRRCKCLSSHSSSHF